MSTHASPPPVFTLAVLNWKAGAVVAILTLVAALAVQRWAFPGPPVVEAGDLVAGPEARLGREVIVAGEWLLTAPSKTDPSAGRYIVVVLRGRDGARVACHFEDVAEDDRSGLERRLLRAPTEIAVRGRTGGVEDGMPVLHGCRLVDGH